MIHVDMGRGDDLVMVVMLNDSYFFLQFMLVVVIDEADDAHAHAAQRDDQRLRRAVRNHTVEVEAHGSAAAFDAMLLRREGRNKSTVFGLR